jgi:glucoamylase
MTDAPGHPGIAPRWTSSAKSGVGTALSPLSRVWFTLSHGILNEVYYPRVDQACIRDLGFLVTDDHGFFSEEKRDTTHRVERVADGIPAFRLTNTCSHGRYLIEKHILTDPARDVVLQSVRLQSLHGDRLRLFALLSPHLVNGGAHNTGWIGDYKGQEMLFAEGGGAALALAASVPWLARSAGFVGSSDGWRDVSASGRLTQAWDRAADGNVALCGELDHAASPAGVLLALAFGRTWSEAAFRARAAVLDGIEPAAVAYETAWRDWQSGLLPLDRHEPRFGHNSYRVSASVLRAHESPSFPGGLIASLSIPWGASKGDDDLGGYHLVWPRDLGETAGGLLACGATAEARRVLAYLRTIQAPDGGWPQNTWLDGLPYWHGVQLDETAFPILIADLAHRNGALTEQALTDLWPMVHAAAAYLCRNGPITGQDRWEEDSGISTFTMAVVIAALLAAADMADSNGAEAAAGIFRDTADAWNASLDDWTYAAGTDLARAAGVAGYYVRITPPEGLFAPVAIKNRPPDSSSLAARDIISPDALALVRFGLRDAHDPRILDTVRAIDHALRVDLPAGPSWHRYNDDGYGEHADGSPFDGVGIGRAWPLLTGERAHYELLAGNIAGAHRLLETLEQLTSSGGLIPEQVWDAEDIPEHELVRGEPSGSAMPLVWAHAEHIKLVRSLADGAVFDLPPQPVRRYLRDRVPPRVASWRPALPIVRMPAGTLLRIDLPGAATIRWTNDGWAQVQETPTVDTGFGLHVAELDPAGAAALIFTWRWADGSWAGADHAVRVDR